MLLKIGEGKFKTIDHQIEIPRELCTLVDNLYLLIEKIYPNLHNLITKPTEWLKERAILTARNDTVNEINNLLMSKFDAEERTYKSYDSYTDQDQAVHFPTEVLNSFSPSGIPDHMLTLKVGAPIMLLRNLKPPKLCNGTRLRVVKLHPNVIEACIFTGCGAGEVVFIPRIPLIPSDFVVEFKRVQFPVRVCFAMTINKAQGQTLSMAGIDLRNECFSHGQFYVAVSRVSSAKNLVILSITNKTANVVYTEVLRN